MPSIRIHDGSPAVLVKDYADHLRGVDTSKLPDRIIERLYEEARETFWTITAPEISREHGYGAVYAEGRSGGWLQVEIPPNVEDDEETEQCDECGHVLLTSIDEETEQCDDCGAIQVPYIAARRAHWLHFEEEIRAAMQAAGADFRAAVEAAVERQPELPVETSSAVSRIAEPGAPEPNGWHREGVYVGDPAGQFPDEALEGFTAFYEHADHEWRGETSYYVEAVETTNLPDVRPAYVVRCVDHTYRVVLDDHGHVVDTERDDYDYEGGSALYYWTRGEAVEAARKLALIDDSHAYMVP